MIEKLSCPSCGKIMRRRIMVGSHVNSYNYKVDKQKYYQYYCEKCDDVETGWTTTQSDKLSVMMNKKDKKNIKP